MQSFSIPFWKAGLLPLLCLGLLYTANTGLGAADTNLPVILRQPVAGIAGVGEDFAFNVLAGGAPPLRYQWRFKGTNLAGATASSLLLTNLTTSRDGTYAVVVTNTSGSVTSSPARLIVQTVFARRLETGRVLSGAPGQVAVPIVLRGNGRENSVSFSLSYNSTNYANPVFISGYPDATIGAVATSPGVLGLSLTRAPGTTFPPGYITLGLVQFDLASGATPLQGGLAFTNSPYPVTATNGAGAALHISAVVPPQYALVTSAPALDRQSGLFKQQMVVGNPGSVVLSNVNILPVTTGWDLLTNHMHLYNGVAYITNYPYRDPLIEIGCNCGCGYVLDSSATNCDFSSYLACATAANCALDSTTTTINTTFAQIHNLRPAESRTLTLEYYVSDHVSVPRVTYSVYAADRVNVSLPVTATPVGILTNRYVNGTFMIEFPTHTGYHYYIQYADTAAFTNALTAVPSIEGNGSRVQWIDDGPPKTVSPPVKGSRFYRVFENP